MLAKWNIMTCIYLESHDEQRGKTKKTLNINNQDSWLASPYHFHVNTNGYTMLLPYVYHPVLSIPYTGESRMIYLNVDAPNLGFSYFEPLNTQYVCLFFICVCICLGICISICNTANSTPWQMSWIITARPRLFPS